MTKGFIKLTVLLLIGSIFVVSCKSKTKKQTQIVVADTTITENIKFCESTYPYQGGLLIANFGTETLNPLNNEGKGYIAYNKEGKTTVFIPVDGNLSAPKGMLEKEGYLYICDVNKVLVYNLKDLKATPQVIPFNEGELFVNDIALFNNNLIVSVTNTGNLFKIDLTNQANLKADLWCNVVGANGVLVKENQIYVASYPADGLTTENNVVYVIDDFNAPNPQKLMDRAGQYDGIVISKDAKTLYVTNWSPAEVISIDLATKAIKNVDIKEKMIGPADLSIIDDVLFIPDLPNSRVIVKAL